MTPLDAEHRGAGQGRAVAEASGAALIGAQAGGQDDSSACRVGLGSLDRTGPSWSGAHIVNFKARPVRWITTGDLDQRSAST